MTYPIEPLRFPWLGLLLLLGSWTVCPAAEEASFDSGAARNSIAERLEGTTIPELLRSDVARAPLKSSDVEEARRKVWEKYREEQASDPARRKEHEEKRVVFSGATMRYEYETIGEKPPGGYPLFIALHGGGGGPARMNDGQWRHMTVYYRSSVDVGIYCAPRGVSNTWNLHFRAESYPLYDRLIENMILFEGVDSNRVYLLGFSAGGDGVYQIVPRMADRWAAASMSAGHHNGTSPVNLYNVPFLLQVGERDRAYDRNRETVRFARKLKTLQEKHPGGYVHQIFVHAGRPHNFLDNHPEEAEQTVLADPFAWLDGETTEQVLRNTNAIAWLRQRERDPVPPRVIWDLKTFADRSGVEASGASLWPVKSRGRQRYWLDIGACDPADVGADRLDARIDEKENSVIVEKAGNYLRILLTARRLDLSRPITVRVGAETFRGRVRPRLETMLRTVLERGDPSFIFDAECVLRRDGETWNVEGLEQRASGKKPER